VIEVEAMPVFRGIVSDISLSYSVTGEATFTLQATDPLSQLAVTTIPAGTVFGEQLSGQRMSSVLSLGEVAYTDPTDISTGLTTLAAETTTDPINTLAYLQAIERSEDGFFFVAADGTLTLKDRHEPLTSPLTLTFSDDGIDTPYQQIERRVPINELVNQLSATVRVDQHPDSDRHRVAVHLRRARRRLG
jgi:hypothetical protein